MSTLFLVLAWCRPIGSSLVVSYTVYYIIFPAFTILIILRKNPLDFGLRLGNYNLWGFYVAITVVIAIPVLYIGSLFSSVGQYYTKPFDYYSFFTQMVPLLFAWEYLLRGFLLFGLKERFKEASILIQMVPFVLLHIGKPEIEILMCIPMGLWFGYIAYRGKSFWPAFITHTFINFILKYFVNF
jgi:membrane protease YdiL (CAAX protease family)